ncbi:hypothetical protein [Sinorhizobium sp. BG8]|uniref:hypothetical protein n=1 Tax=Sinorhizobium sp. BG8 TaxID=2613773 RepID=UPI001FEE99DC|nr:hypothetical protein [Sinorhizobium sp. BG8]
MRYPENRAGQVWVEQYFAALAEFFQSGREDGAALARAAQSLAHLLQRAPTYAAETRQLAAQFVMANWNAGWPEVIVDAVRTGMDADIISPELRAVPAPAALLHICMAEARNLDGERLLGLQSLGRALNRLEEAAEDDLLALFLRGRALVLRGELQEIGREQVRALEDFRAAESVLAPLVEDQNATSAIADAWILQIFGPKDDGSLAGQTDGMAAMALHQFNDSFVRSLMGIFRTDPNTPDGGMLSKLKERIQTYGLGTAVNPILMLPALSRLDPGTSVEIGSFLAHAAAEAPGRLTVGAMSEGLAPELRSLVEKFAQSKVDPAIAALWELVTKIAKARGIARAGDRSTAVELLNATFRQTFETPTSAVGKALAIGELAREVIVAAQDEDFADSMCDLFFLVFEAAWRADPEAFRDLRFRSQFDEAIAAVAGRRLERERVETEQDLLSLSVLLDLLRVTDMPSVLGLSDEAPFETPNAELRAGFALLGNTLSRTVDGVAERFGTVAVITHDVTPTEGFLILVTEDGIEVARKDAALAKAFENLDGAIVYAPEAPQEDKSAFDPVRRPAEAVWQALPPAVRNAIAGADVLHVAPDFRSTDTSEPWEMIHDGKDYLLNSTIVIRHGSLRQMARTFDTRSARRRKNRALIVAALTAFRNVPCRPLRGNRKASARFFETAKSMRPRSRRAGSAPTS